MERPMQKLTNLSRSLTALEPNGTLIAVIEMSLSSWLVAGIVPGLERQPLKKLAVDESTLLKLLYRWREEAEKAGRRIHGGPFFLKWSILNVPIRRSFQLPTFPVRQSSRPISISVS